MNHRPFLVLSVVFGLLFLIISLGNFYWFHSTALDLGVFNHALYQLAHFHAPTYTLSVLGDPEMSFFADHFSPAIFLFVPFYFLLGNITCLVLQVLAIVIGALFIYRYALLKELNERIALAASLLFFVTWGTWGAVSFDFHLNVIAAMAVPALFYYHEKINRPGFVLSFLLIILSKENMALWAGFILIGLLLNDIRRKRKNAIVLLSSMATFSFIYFFLVVGFLMPSLHPDDANIQLHRFSKEAVPLNERIGHLIANPWDTIQLLWLDHEGNPAREKMRLHFMALLSGGILWFFRPWYIIMLIPVYAQKFLSFDDSLWGIHGHYSIEFVPLISLVFVDSIKDFTKKIQHVVIVLFIGMAAYLSYTELIRNVPNCRFFDPEFYDAGINTDDAEKVLQLIPENVAVSLSSHLAPHFKTTRPMYHFPVVNDATFIGLIKCCRSTYPVDENKYLQQIELLRSSNEWKVIFETWEIVLFEKN